jgi:DNA invertase Pin-like site-specific DNA recombinase
MVAGCYARKSTDEGDNAADAKSVARQVQRAKEYAAKKGWRFDDDLVFTDDGISGAEFRTRAGLNRLLETVKGKHKLNVLIVSEQSRLGRDTIRTLALIQALTDADVRIFSYLEDKGISVDDEMAEVEQFMKSWAGASERRKASQRVRDKMRQLAEQGRSTGGRLFGYETKDGLRTVQPSEAAVIGRIFKRRSEGAGYFKIARELERDRVASPRGSRLWSPTQVGSILANETYAGVSVWGRTRQTKRRGTSVTEKSPDAVVRREAPALRIVSEKLWREVQAVNKAATESTWRSPDGRLKSRPTTGRHFLPQFIACGICGGSMHIRFDKKRREFLFCTNRHLLGKAKCPNARRLPVEFAERVFMHAFEEALAGALVMEKLEEVLEQQRRAQRDPAPLHAEAKRLHAEISRLVASLARGEVEEVHQAIAERKARLAQVEGELSGTAAIQGIDVERLRASIEEVAEDWRAHLRKNRTVAAQVLRKILPERVAVTPLAGGGWSFDGATNYSKMLEEVGYKAVLDALKSHGMVSGIAELPHEVKHPAGECRPEYACWPGETKVSKTRCPSPCSARPSARGTPRSRRTPPRSTVPSAAPPRSASCRCRSRCPRCASARAASARPSP